jgi:hypothetical protein
MEKIIVQFEMDVPEEAIRLAAERDECLRLFLAAERTRQVLMDIYDAQLQAGKINLDLYHKLMHTVKSESVESINKHYNDAITRVIDDAVDAQFVQDDEICLNVADIEAFDQILNDILRVILPKPTVDDLRPSDYQWGDNIPI